ncbi:TIGR04282 family arsenosugar biosynthesis glycosyltransferase [Streptomyces smyrnaeus]|uniref:TIGR04282 family arsenosugar biosynthesis glycosyltransferase n=1 Tax=Streptomyces smyrnaeus TaxID=1387713 RepID=UPI003692460F
MPVPEPTTLLVMAKEPRAGRAKTRLAPAFTPQGAAALASAALTDTLRTALATPACRRVLVLDGSPGPWLPGADEGGDRIEIVPQADGGLDERLAAAFALCEGPALLVGMDTPQLTPALLAPATRPHAWQDHDAYFGPAADGGFWALGLAAPDPALLRGVPMSTATTGAVQRARLVAAGLRVGDLPQLRDVDEPDDAAAVAAQAPGSLFAAELARLRRLLGPGHAPTAPPRGAPGVAEA